MDLRRSLFHRLLMAPHWPLMAPHWPLMAPYFVANSIAEVAESGEFGRIAHPYPLRQCWFRDSCVVRCLPYHARSFD
jgi:hypothetical protein